MDNTITPTISPEKLEILTDKEIADLIALTNAEAKPSEDLHWSLNPQIEKNTGAVFVTGQEEAEVRQRESREQVKFTKKKGPLSWERMLISRRTIVADLYLKDYTSKEIAAEINVWLKSTCGTDYTVDDRVIRQDVIWLKEKWRAQQQKTINEIVTMEMVKLGQREQQALLAFHESQRDRVVVVKEHDKDKNLVTEKTTTTGQAGDSAFLTVALKCMEMRGRMLGYLKMKEIELTLTDATGNPITPPRAEDIQNLQKSIDELKGASQEDLQAIVAAGEALKRIGPGNVAPLAPVGQAAK